MICRHIATSERCCGEATQGVPHTSGAIHRPKPKKGRIGTRESITTEVDQEGTVANERKRSDSGGAKDGERPGLCVQESCEESDM